MAGKTRDADQETKFWWGWTMVGAAVYIAVVFGFILF
jgi:hypothetical protein